MSTLQLDTHVLHWWTSEPERVSEGAAAAITGAEDLAVADITWYELAWLAANDRINLAVPLRTWLGSLAATVRTVAVSPGVAATAAELPATFRGDPADRLIYATAIENGWDLVTKDRALRDHPYPRRFTIW